MNKSLKKKTLKQQQQATCYITRIAAHFSNYFLFYFIAAILVGSWHYGSERHVYSFVRAYLVVAV